MKDILFYFIYNHVFVIWLYKKFLVHINVCDFTDTMLIVVQINLIWFDSICKVWRLLGFQLWLMQQSALHMKNPNN